VLKKTIKYTDYDGGEREEDFYFNLSKAEITEMEASVDGGMSEMLKRVVSEKDIKKIVEIFKMILEKSYGKKSPDGRKFVKNEELWADFIQTEAYSKLFIELMSDAEEAKRFINGIIPV